MSFKHANKNLVFWEAVSTLVGTIIGAGMLGIPYVVAKAGFLTGLLLMLVIGLVTMFLNLFIAEVVLRTKKKLQLSGYAGKYLGKWAKYLISVVMVIEIYGAMTAYLIGEGQAIYAIFGGSAFVYTIFFFIGGMILLYFGLNVIKSFELLLTIFIFVIITAITIWGGPHIDLDKLIIFDWYKLFIPFGVVVFAFAGASSIYPVREILRRREKDMKKAIVFGSLIPLVIYILFTLVVIGITGVETSKIATVALGEVIGDKMLIVGNLFAIFAMATSFLTLGIALIQTFNLDYKINKIMAWILTGLVPLFVYLFISQNFIKILSLVGGVLGSIVGVIFVLMYWQAKKKSDRKPEYSMRNNYVLGSVIILMFVCGFLYTIYEVFMNGL